ncbi:MAG TPA: FeoB-associated Cys-rich membrane protein [Pyrinomonadaceae bacterium]|nr:FeoB-associated Cys-rich membrane protein [Pyrinomonadaceae bacterium]
MNFDWQAVVVALIIAVALLYLGRRALARLRSFKVSKGGGSCATGCGTCGDVDAPLRQSNILVQVDKAKRAKR